MGQNASAEEKVDTPDISGGSPKPQVKHRNHEFFISNGDLETVGDLDSVLQAINVSPTPEGRLLFHSYDPR